MYNVSLQACCTFAQCQAKTCDLGSCVQLSTKKPLLCPVQVHACCNFAFKLHIVSDVLLAGRHYRVSMQTLPSEKECVLYMLTVLLTMCASSSSSEESCKAGHASLLMPFWYSCTTVSPDARSINCSITLACLVQSTKHCDRTCYDVQQHSQVSYIMCVAATLAQPPHSVCAVCFCTYEFAYESYAENVMPPAPPWSACAPSDSCLHSQLPFVVAEKFAERRIQERTPQRQFVATSEFCPAAKSPGCVSEGCMPCVTVLMLSPCIACAVRDLALPDEPKSTTSTWSAVIVANKTPSAHQLKEEAASLNDNVC